jgi:molecular chaperone GrpE (heat shock protein)
MREKVLDIINNYKDKSNQDLMTAMDFLNQDFESTKKKLFELSNYLDSLEVTYNTLLKEFKKRNIENGE